MLTGIDRVELAYLDHLVAGDTPLFGLVRTSVGYLILGREGCATVAGLTRGQIDTPPPDLFSRLARRQQPLRAGAEALLRRQALARVLPSGLGRALRRLLPAGASYLNVGHADLSDATLRALRQVPGLRITVMLHDVIPLDHPEFARPDTVVAFSRRLAAVSTHADLVIHTAEATRAATEAQLARAGRVPDGLTAPLGVEMPRPGPLPPDLPPQRPYFVALGTIEPRKNHALLLDIWQHRRPPADLIIAGPRGWAAPDLFARLDAGIPGVHEVNDLDDGAVASLLRGSQALLFPSLAEGFGLPAIEALMLGCPVICSDLPVFREILGDKAVYADPSDRYSWLRGLERHLTATRPVIPDQRNPDDEGVAWGWRGHFNKVLSAV